MMRKRLGFNCASGVLLLSMTVGAWVPTSASGQTTEPAATEPVEQITKAEVETQLKNLDELKELPEEAKAKCSEMLQQALQQIEARTAADAAVAQYQRDIDTAVDDIAAQKRTRDELPEKAAVISAPPLDTPLDQLEPKLSDARKQLTETEEAHKKLEGEPNRRTARLADIPKLIQAAEEQLDAVDKELSVKTPENEPASLTAAKRTLGLAKQQALKSTLISFEKERAFYEATGELVQIRRDIAAKRLAIARDEAQQWQAIVNTRRKELAEKQAETAAEKVAMAPPAVQELVERNKQLTTERAALSDKIEKATGDLESIRKLHDQVATEFHRTRDKVEAVGLSQASGSLLREERGELPDVRQHLRSMQERQPVLGEARFRIYELNDRRSDLATLEPHVEEILTNAGADRTAGLEAEVRNDLKAQREYLDALINDYQTYSNRLIELDDQEQQLIDATEEYADFIDGRVHWISSTVMLSHHDRGPAVDAARWLVSYENWYGAGAELMRDMMRHPLMWLIGFAAVLPLLYYQRRWRRGIGEIGQSVSRRGFHQFAPTLRVVGLTFLISIPWPLIMWFYGWRLGRSLYATDFSRAISKALIVSATVYLSLDFLRHTCRPLGLADMHFAWPRAAVNMVRSRLRWLMLFGLPLLFVTVATDAQTQQPLWGSSLGRAAFMAFLVLLAVLIQRILRPAGGVFQQMFAYNSGGWLYRLRYVWYPLVTAAPVGLAMLALIGYYDTSLMLARQILGTVWLAVGLAIVGALLNRWVLMTRRRQALEQARQRIAAEQAAASQDAPGTPVTPDALNVEVDLASVSVQTRRLIRASLFLAAIVGGWLIWIDIVPALSILSTITVGPAASEITLADVALALLVVIIAYVASKNVPGLLEFTVLNNLPLDAGSRYAITTISRYLIGILGMSLAGLAIGITWNSIQWLVAAMSIGLGFGLQEIFANFISGIILLFERPIRVGDIITLGETTGTVTRINMRATTITDWDRKEFLVPNKDLVTGRLLNWTLTDQTNRIVIQVGVAYGSDTERARRLLLQAAEGHPLILKDPAPMATFEGFGDSTLNLLLRCYLPNLENRLATVTDLHTTIDKTFQEADIEIAFPQQDIHLRSMDFPVNVMSGNGAAAHNGGAEKVSR